MSGTARRITDQDKQEFRGYLRACTDAQVQGVYDKETSAGRKVYAALAVDEAARRGIELVRLTTRHRGGANVWTV
jgi:hypothetical protein